ncbi:tetratricopeptide repeat protein [Mucilaginibacter sp. dw_454]|uniref:tetratricopeptide repeat protein n=1 Tax=Mucilaginibacter sp. dw_454 TaxID=2720079 RepID=UPI001BD42BCA|nr:tetratricopeptide repeat protein [Mucilaginibacter sp. dw_454]
MKQLLIIVIFLGSGLQLFAQQERSYVKKGNELYQQKKYKEAEEAYREAVAKKEQNVPGNFNLGDALYKQKQYDKAADQFKKIADAGGDKNVVAHAYHNLGNSMLQNQKLEESVDAYKKSLLNNPKDEETRYNLAYAQEKLKKQQQQQQKDGKNNKDNKDQKQNQDKNNQDKKNNDDKKNQDKKDQQKQDKQQQSNPNNISKEDAQRMLDALNNDEKQTQDKLKGKKARGTAGRPAKDW